MNSKPTSGELKWLREEPDYSNIESIDWAVIAGFLCGEGCFTIAKGVSTPIITVGLHWEDEATLVYLQSLLGGSISHWVDRETGKSSAQWNVSGLLQCKGILEGTIPYVARARSLKLQDVQVMLDYINWRITKPQRLKPEDIPVREAYRKHLKDVKVRHKLGA